MTSLSSHRPSVHRSWTTGITNHTELPRRPSGSINPNTLQNDMQSYSHIPPLPMVGNEFSSLGARRDTSSSINSHSNASVGYSDDLAMATDPFLNGLFDQQNLDMNTDFDFFAALDMERDNMFMPIINEVSDDMGSIIAPEDGKSPRTTCSQKSVSCVMMATGLVKALHVSPSECLSNELSRMTSVPSTISQPRLRDSVIKCNRDAVMLVLNMLRCNCSSRPQLLLVLVAICDKIVAWYRAIAQSDSSFQEINGPNQNAEQVVRESQTSSEQYLESSLVSKIRHQVLSGELQRLEIVVKKLETRAKEGAAAPSNSSPKMGEHNGLSTIIHTSVLQFLLRQVEEVKALMGNQ